MRKTIERIKDLLAENRGKAIVAAISFALVIIALAIGSCALQGPDEPRGRSDNDAQTLSMKPVRPPPKSPKMP